MRANCISPVNIPVTHLPAIWKERCSPATDWPASSFSEMERAGSYSRLCCGRPSNHNKACRSALEQLARSGMWKSCCVATAARLPKAHPRLVTILRSQTESSRQSLPSFKVVGIRPTALIPPFGSVVRAIPVNFVPDLALNHVG
jgi:hypothetical protein